MAAQKQVTDQEPSGFNEMVLKAVDSALSETFGPSVAIAIKFYLDSSLILKNPDFYGVQLRRIFSGSEAGANMVERRIAANLSKMLNQHNNQWRSGSDGGAGATLKESDFKNFHDFIELCKKNYLLSK